MYVVSTSLPPGSIWSIYQYTEGTINNFPYKVVYFNTTVTKKQVYNPW